MKSTCRYCKATAIGYEVERYDLSAWRFPVCSGCAHHGATVHLYAGGTYRRPPARKADR